MVRRKTDFILFYSKCQMYGETDRERRKNKGQRREKKEERRKGKRRKEKEERRHNRKRKNKE